MAIIIGEDPKVGHRNEHFDAKEQWDSLSETIQPEMRIAAENLMKESSQDPYGSTGGIPSIMEEPIDMSNLHSLSFIMNAQNISSNSLLVNSDTTAFLKGIDDICPSELNTPDISDLNAFVFSSEVTKDTSSVENMVSIQPTIIPDATIDTMPGNPYSPEILTQGLLEKIDDCPPEHIFDSSLDEKKIEYNNTDNTVLDKFLLDNFIPDDSTNYHAYPSVQFINEVPVKTAQMNVKLDIKNDHFVNSINDNSLNINLPTINYEDLLSQENILSEGFEIQRNEILDSDKDELVNSFLNSEEDYFNWSAETPLLKLEEESSIIYPKIKLSPVNENTISPPGTLNRESILNSFKKIHGESAAFIGNIKYIIPKRVEPVIQNPVRNIEPIIVTIRDQNTYIKNEHLKKNSFNAREIKIEANEVSSSTSNVSNLDIISEAFPSTSDGLNLVSEVSSSTSDSFYILPSSSTPSTSKVTQSPNLRESPTRCKASKRKIRAPSKYEDEITSDSFEDEIISAHRSKKRGKFSLQGLSDAEKYQRIRLQNNVASKKCRDKKKQEQHKRIHELQKEESKSKQLKTQIESLELKALKWRKLFKSACFKLY